MALSLTDEQIDEALARLPEWTREGGAIARTVTSSSFPDAIALLDAVAAEAEAMDHHPDMDVRWRSVTSTLSTYSEGGITSLDVVLAGAIDRLAAR